MKILRLDLTAFGPFTQSHIDLAGGDYGFHLVYGPNEAGKSSSLRAITNLLYGFPHAVGDAFTHESSKLRIGGVLKTADGQRLEFVRRRGRKNTLRIGDDSEPVDESRLRNLLGSVDRELFELMFGINHQRLVEGGREIAIGEGQIGEMLFAAGAGLTGLQAIQSELQQDADALLKSTGRSGLIHERSVQFRELRKSVNAAQVSVDVWKKYDADVQQANAQRTQLIDEIHRLDTEKHRLMRIKNAIPLAAIRSNLKTQLGTTPQVPPLPPQFAEQSQRLLTELATTRQQESDATDAVQTLNETLQQIEVPESVLQEADAIEGLRDQIGSYRGWLSDRPKVEAQRDAAERDILAALRSLGREPDLAKVRQLQLPTGRSVRITELANQQVGLKERHRSAERDRKKAAAEIEAIEQKLNQLPPAVDHSALRSLLREAQPHDGLEQRLADLRQQQSQIAQTIGMDLKRLPLWSGDAETLVQRPTPSGSTIDQFAEQFNNNRNSQKAVRQDIRETEERQQQLIRDLQKLEQGHTVATQQQLDGARSLRDQGWQLVRDALEKKSSLSEQSSRAKKFVARFDSATSLADAYAASVRAADAVGDELRNDAERVAEKMQLEFRQREEADRHETLRSQSKQMDLERDEIQQQWNQVWRAFGFQPLSPVEMRDWLRQQESLVQTVRRQNDIEIEIAQIEQQHRHLRERLVQSLSIGESTPADADSASLPELMQHLASKCESLQSVANERQQLEKSLGNLATKLETATTEFTEIAGELEAAQSTWAADMAELGLPDDALPAQANSYLAELRDLLQVHREWEKLGRRLSHIDDDRTAFEANVGKVAERVSGDLKNLPADQVIADLTRRLQVAREAANDRKTAGHQLAKQQQRLSESRSKLSATNAALQQLISQAGCEHADELSKVAETAATRRTLEQRLADADSQLIELSGGASLDDFLAEIDALNVDADGLPPKIEQLENEIARLNEQRDEWTRKVDRAEAELRRIDGNDVAVEREAECQHIAASLEQDVQRLAVLRLASAVLVAGIESHRRKNQGPVLNRASEMFRRFTVGAFAGLKADYDTDGNPVLVGVRAVSEDDVPISGMSDGTCDQVFLALRLASLESWLDQHEPIPLIVDDILMNFDDDRSIATLEVLAELSRRTQVIFFTHHQHLVDIAGRHLAASDLFVTGIAGQEEQRNEQDRSLFASQ